MLSPGFHIRPAREEDSKCFRHNAYKSVFQILRTHFSVSSKSLLYEKAEADKAKSIYFTLLVISPEDQAVAFTLYYFNSSTWTGRPGLCLGDLFVNEEYRSKGIGRALFSELAKIAQEKNCARMDWAALKWNTLSRNFYEKGLGAQLLNDAICLRLEEDGIEKLKNFNIEQ